MLIDTGITLAYKCPACGTYEFFESSLFKLVSKKDDSFVCHCSKSKITLIKEKGGNYQFTIPCIGCGENHSFALPRKDFLKEISVFYCPKTGIHQCFMGADSEVRKRIDSLQKELDDLINKFGYDNYFKNTQVMMDILNKIHDVAEGGNLFCECGNSQIALSLLSDKVYLTCNKCAAVKVISAASNEDLKAIVSKPKILLSSDLCSYFIPNTKKNIRRTNRK